MKILLTGGAGYIGSHTFAALVEAGHSPIILDNFSTSSPAVLDRLALIAGEPVACERGDVLDTPWVESVLRHHRPEAVVHFAGFKAVGESVQDPVKYYRNNVCGTVSLLRAMEAARCRILVFSSSATVYGDPDVVPVKEDAPLRTANPYGHTKLVIEEMLAAQCAANPAWKVAVLRYFNPIGAHPSGLIGEDLDAIPNNLMPYITQVMAGRRPYLEVFGTDYPTPDGTGVRDYLHVCDLAEGHVAALEWLLAHGKSLTVNLGTGHGHSVLEVLHAFEKACGRPVPYRLAPRRPGDVARYFADPGLAERCLGWRARRSLDEMCADSWHWLQANPEGYRSAVRPTATNLTLQDCET
jgi:UDP-glucose 4-epimerase